VRDGEGQTCLWKRSVWGAYRRHFDASKRRVSGPVGWGVNLGAVRRSQQLAYIHARAPSLQTAGDRPRLLPKSVDSEQRGVEAREMLGDLTKVYLCDLQRESVREEEEGATFVATVTTRWPE
jgi:hypothetical protein